MKFLDPKTDTAFKKIFGNEHRKNLTMSLLNSILERKNGNLITDVSFRETAYLPEIKKKKNTFVDINCMDQLGQKYIIEIQVVDEFNFLQRSLYYGSNAIVQQMEKGDRYEAIVPVIFIGMLNHTLFNTPDAITHHFIMNAKTQEQSLPYLEFHYVELPKFHTTMNELQTDTDKWLFFMKHAENLETIPQNLESSEEFVEAFHVLEKALWSDEELEHYKADQAQIGREQRQQEGARKAEKEAFAIKLLKKGYAINEIVDLTDLTVAYINTIAKKFLK